MKFISNLSTHAFVIIVKSQEKSKTVKMEFSEFHSKIKNGYNQVPQLTQDTNGKVTNSQLDTTNESQEVSPFPAGDHKAHII